MKKLLALFLALLILPLAGAGAAVTALRSQENTATLTLRSIEGDPSAVDGLNLTLTTTHDYLFWRNLWSLDANGAEDLSNRWGDLRLDYSRQLDHYAEANPFDTPDTVEQMIGMSREDAGLGSKYPTSSYFSMDSYPFSYYDEYEENPQGLSRAYHDMVAAQPNADDLSSIVRLCDYQDYYTLNFTLQFAEFFENFDALTATKEEMDEFMNRPRLDDQAMSDFFRIPVLEEETWEISLSEKENGHFRHRSLSVTDSDRYEMTSMSILSEYGVFFTFRNRTRRGNIVDTSLIPGGYGLYFLPITEFDPKEEQLCNILPLDSQTKILALEDSPDQQHILLFTAEEDQYFLTIIEAATLEIQERIPYFDQKQEQWYLHTSENNLFLAEGDEEYVLFAPTGNGYEPALRCPSVPGLFHYKASSGLYGEVRYEMAFDGRRLALLTEEQHLLSVFTDQGRIYSGQWFTSLMPQYHYETAEHQSKLTDYRPIVLNWTQ